MVEFYLIRQQETIANKQGKVQGQRQGKLTKKGKKTAFQIGLFLGNLTKFDALYFSDLRRAVQTAREILKSVKTKKVYKTPLIRERCFGKLQGQSITKLRKIKPYFVTLDAGQAILREKNAEPLNKLKQRIKRFLHLLLKRGHRRVIVVGHNLFNNHLLNYLSGKNFQEYHEDKKHGDIYRVRLSGRGKIISCKVIRLMSRIG